MGETTQVRGGGVGFTGLLTILFIGLKLGGIAPVALWSWWWVLSPLWISVAIGVFLVIVALILAAIFD